MNAYALDLLAVLALTLWVVAGLADWYCHRATHIATTAGIAEARLHVAQAITIAVALFGALFLAPTTGAYVLMSIALLAHTALAWWDTAYAAPRRRISPVEQHAHAVLEMVPLAALAVFGALHAEAVLDGNLRLEWRTPLPRLDRVLVLCLPLVVPAIALLEEYLRCERSSDLSAS